MTNKTWSRNVVALLATAAILSVDSTLTLATAGVRGAELSVFGEVSLNGQKAMSGVTIFSECVVVTAQGSSASVSLSKLGRIELSANTNLKLSFADNSITGQLESGRARFSTAAGVPLNLKTSAGLVLVDGSQATSFIVNTENGNTTVEAESGQAELRADAGTTKIGAGEVGAPGVPQSKKKDDDAKPQRGSLWAALLATGGVIAAAIWVITHDKETRENDLDFGGTIADPSPR